jgi:hypothetical protein
MKPGQSVKIAVIAFFLMALFAAPVCAEDSEVNRATLAGLQGVYVVVEELQPNVLKYAAKFGLNKAQIKQDVERWLHEGGVRTVAGIDWQNIPGRPMLYININTHETAKYWYAYDVSVQLRQMATLDANPALKTMATTWSLSITGSAHIGTLQIIREDAGMLVGRFVQAYKSKNK